MKKMALFLMAVLMAAQVMGQGAVTVVTPNGGETWTTGCPVQIQWTTTSATTPARIDLYRNNLFCMTIAGQVPPGMTTFSWIVAYNLVTGNDYRVKVSLLSSAPVFDFSDAPFTISKGTITVGSPNGGENWVKGTVHPILWTDNICENVRIELWKGNAFHSLIAASVPSNGTFSWTVPNTNTLIPASDYRVKILGVANSAGTTGMVFDFSDAAFTISSGQPPAPVVIVSPNGGETWITGCTYQVQWISAATSPAPVKLELFRDNAFHMTIAQQVPAGQNFFQWSPPASLVPGAGYKVKVTSLTSPPTFDFSDTTFSIIRGTITVTAPNGGETWAKGTMHPITWTDNVCGNVRIELWKAGALHSVVAQSVPSNGTFNWNIPNSNSLLPGNDYKIKVMGLANSTTSANMVTDFSDSAFTILPGSPAGQIMVVTPNGGETWITGCPALIQWVTTATTIGPVKIDLYKNNVFHLTICPQVPAGQMSFTWTTPSYVIPGNDYKVKVTSLSNPDIHDFSNGNFEITRGNITVVSPNGGETWVKGTMHPILWSDNLCDNIRIELWKGNTFHSTIATSVPSTGSFNWTIPNVASLAPGSDYRVKILNPANATTASGVIFDFSNNNFTIAEGQNTSQITVITPNGGENWITGCPALINWTLTSASTVPVKIELYKNNLYVMTIAQQLPGVPGSFSWMPPMSLITGNDYKVKISTLTSPAAFDFSDSVFTISRGAITVISPNGGETWLKGTIHPILWTDNICENVRIELWKGNMLNHVIAQSVPSNGTFNWMIPATSNLLPASDYRVKIVSIAANSGTTGMVYDFSDSAFTIAGQGNTLAPVNLSVEKTWPNPCRDMITLTVASPTDETATLEIYDRMGLIVHTTPIDLKAGSQDVEIRLPALSTGTYIYVIRTSQGTTARGRFMVQR